MNRLLVVVGCPRSGTTWLQRLLLSHPDVVGPPAETSLFTDLGPAWSLVHSPQRDWSDRATGAAAVRHFCDRVFAGVPGTAQAALFVEKTPAHVLCLDRVAALYPDVAVVHLVRDGRDVARSIAELAFGMRDLESGAALWGRCLDAFDRARPRLQHAREVRYEDLVAQPVGVTTELLEWAGAPPRTDLIQRIEDTVGDRVSQFNTTGPVGSGKWRTMSTADLAKVYAVAAAHLRDRGYLDAGEFSRIRRHPRVLLGRARRRLARITTTDGQGVNVGSARRQ